MEIKPPVAIDQIAEPTDRFRCEPYKSVILARACAERQAMSTKPRDQRSGDYVYCTGCQDGPRVLQQLKLISPESLVRATPRVTLTQNGKKRGRPKKNAAAPKPAPPPSKATIAAVAAQPAALPKKPPGTKRAPPPKPTDPSPPPPPPSSSEPQRRDGPELGPHAPEEPTAPGASPKPADPTEPEPQVQAADPLEDFTSEMQRIEEGLLGIEQRARDLKTGLRALRARLGRKP